MEQTILTKAQKAVIDVVGAEPMLFDFYLTGGTALAAYYLNHRISDDLDFFIFKEPDKMFLHGFAERLRTAISAETVRFERLYDRNQFYFKLNTEELKVEFTKYPFPQLEQPIARDGIKIDSLRDIAANKLMALLDRFDPKDFVDMFFLLRQFDLESLRKDVEKKFGARVDDIFLGGELAKVKRITALPKMMKKLSIEELKDFFAKRARELEPNILE